MTRLGLLTFLATVAVLILDGSILEAEATNEDADFKEVFDVVRAHLGGLSETELNRAAVEGFINALSPKVTLITNGGTSQASSSTLSVTKSAVFEGAIADLRVEGVGNALPGDLRGAFNRVLATNVVKGFVLDLRYAGGDDYEAAAATADLFIPKQRSLLNWGKGEILSKEKSDAIIIPLAILVNRQTSGAAEALAGILRETGAGLLLGSRTAGRALVGQDFPLSNGMSLRIATASVQLGDGTVLSPQGLKPDIAVEVNPRDERNYYADAFKVVPKSTSGGSTNNLIGAQSGGTNRNARRPNFPRNEAELVKARKEGFNLDLLEESSQRGEEADKPAVHDPVLARALDLLKGLAIVSHSKP